MSTVPQDIVEQKRQEELRRQRELALAELKKQVPGNVGSSPGPEFRAENEKGERIESFLNKLPEKENLLSYAAKKHVENTGKLIKDSAGLVSTALTYGQFMPGETAISDQPPRYELPENYIEQKEKERNELKKDIEQQGEKLESKGKTAQMVKFERENPKLAKIGDVAGSVPSEVARIAPYFTPVGRPLIAMNAVNRGLEESKGKSVPEKIVSVGKNLGKEALTLGAFKAASRVSSLSPISESFAQKAAGLGKKTAAFSTVATARQQAEKLEAGEPITVEGVIEDFATNLPASSLYAIPSWLARGKRGLPTDTPELKLTREAKARGEAREKLRVEGKLPYEGVKGTIKTDWDINQIKQEGWIPTDRYNKGNQQWIKRNPAGGIEGAIFTKARVEPEFSFKGDVKPGVVEKTTPDYQMPTQPLAGGIAKGVPGFPEWSKSSQTFLKKAQEKPEQVQSGPRLRLIDDVTVKDIHGNKTTFKKGHDLSTRIMGGQVLAQDGNDAAMPKNQFEALKGKAVELGEKSAIRLPKDVSVVVKGHDIISPRVINVNTSFGDDVEFDSVDEMANAINDMGLMPEDGLIEGRDYEKAYDLKPKFAQFITNKGDNYKETLIVVPTTKRRLTEEESIERSRLGLKGKLTPEEKQRYLELNAIEIAPTTDFKSSHWDEPNVIAHLLTSEYQTPKGEKVFNINETQSDWEKKGRSEGFDKDIDEWKAASKFKVQKIPNEDGWGVYDENGRAWFTTIVEANAIRKAEELNQRGIAAGSKRGNVPYNPHLKNWLDISLTQALKDAVESGAKYLSWDDGQTVKDRYDLSKHVDEVGLAELRGGYYQLIGEKNGDLVIEQQFNNIDKLQDYVGKDISKKLIDQSYDDSGYKRLSGENLSIGAAWADHLYNRIIPKKLKEMTKKLGGRLVEIEVNDGSKKQAILITPEIIQAVQGGLQPMAGGITRGKLTLEGLVKGSSKVPSGMTRLYRVEPKDLGNKGEWLKNSLTQEQYKEFLSRRGRLFSDNIESLKNYGWGSGDFNHFYVDVPNEVAQKIASKHPDGFMEYLLPDEYLAQKKEIAQEQPAVGEQSLLEEARKYKTAEEFVNSVTKGAKKLSVKDRPTVYADDIVGIADGLKPYKTVGELKFYDDGSQIIAKKGNKEVGYIGRLSDTETDLAVAQEFQKQGFGKKLTAEFFDRYPEMVRQSGGFTPAGKATYKSQLTDIWNKARGLKADKNLSEEEASKYKTAEESDVSSVVNAYLDAKKNDRVKLPKGWYLHADTGKGYGKVIPSQKYAIQAYSSEAQNPWAYMTGEGDFAFRPTSKAKVLDLSSSTTDDFIKLKKQLEKQIKSGRVEETALEHINEYLDGNIDDIMRSFSPESIGDSAQAYDNLDFVNWLRDTTEADFVITPDGGVIIGDASKMQQVRLSDFKDKSQLTDIWNKTHGVGEQSLLEEARKYKTAEEFVDAQGKPVYHGTNKEIKRFKISSSGDLGEGAYFTPDKYAAQRFAWRKAYNQGGKQKIYEVYLYYNKPLKLGIGIDGEKALEFYRNRNYQAITKLAKENGYDAVIREGIGDIGDEIAVFSPKQIKTKSQLTDIWNKAHGVGEQSLLEEARKYKTAEEFGIKRSRPKEEIVFNTPLTGSNGTQLLSYEWQWKPEETINLKGDNVVRRISDWENAINNLETGRDIVHNFKIKTPSGEIKSVSLESAIKLLGGENTKNVKSISSTLKSIVKNKLQLQGYRAQLELENKISDSVNKLDFPEYIISKRSSGEGYQAKMGDAVVWMNTPDITPERLQTLQGSWKSNRIKEMGGNPHSSLPQKIYNTELAIDKLQKKIDAQSQLTDIWNKAHGVGGGKDFKDLKLFHGSKGKVSEETKSFQNVWENDNQNNLLKELAKDGVKEAGFLVGKYKPNNWVLSDRLIARIAKSRGYDAVMYSNSDRPQLGYEIHDVNEGKFYAEKKELAELYAKQKRDLKHKSVGAAGKDLPTDNIPLEGFPEKLQVKNVDGESVNVTTTPNEKISIDLVQNPDGTVEYELHDGKTVTIPASTALKLAKQYGKNKIVATASTVSDQLVSDIMVDGKKVPRPSFRVDKINAPEDVINLMKQVAEKEGEFKSQRPTGSLKELQRLAKEAKITVDDLLDLPPGSIVSSPELIKANQIRIALAKDLSDYSKKIDTSVATPEELKIFKEKTLRFTAVMKTLAGMRTEASNIFRSFQIVNTPQDEAALRELLGDIKRIDKDAAGDLEQFAKNTRKAMEPTTADKIWHLWYASILSGPLTHIKNITSNVVQLGLELGRISLTSPTEVPSAIFGLLSNMSQAGKDSFEAFTKGKISKLEDQKKLPVRFTGRFTRLLNVSNYVGNALEGVDTFFKTLTYGMDMRQIAFVEGKSKGLKGKKLHQFINERVQNPTEEMQAAAKEYMLYMTYQQRPNGILGVLAEALGKAARKQPALRPIVPFTRVVANVANNAIDWTPWGFARWGFEKVRDVKGQEGRWAKDKRGRGKMLGRALIGTLAMTAFAYLAAQKKLTGRGPSDPKKRKQMLDAGWRPHSFVFSDKDGNKIYVPYTYILGPAALTAAIPANFFDAIRYGDINENDALDRASIAILGSMRLILDMSFLNGISDTLSAIENYDLFGPSYLKRMMSQPTAPLVPNLIKQIDRYFDPTVYNTDKLKDYLLNSMRITSGLKPQINLLGDAVVGDKLTQFTSSDLSKDPVKRFLFNNNLFISVPNKNSKLYDIKKDEMREMTDDEMYNFIGLSGLEIRKRLEDENIMMELLDIKKTEDALQPGSGQEAMQNELNKIVRSARSDIKFDMEDNSAPKFIPRKR